MSGHTRSQAAEALGVSVKTLYTWEKRGLIPEPERDARGWRRYTLEQMATLRSVLRELHPGRAHRDDQTVAEGISARNRLEGIVKSVRCEGILAEVVIELAGGQEVVAVITRGSVDRLGLRPGERAAALIKATEVMIAR